MADIKQSNHMEDRNKGNEASDEHMNHGHDEHKGHDSHEGEYQI